MRPVNTGTDITLNDAAREVLDGPHFAEIATSNADGRPQSSVIVVKRDGDTVVFSTIKGRLKTRNMARPPRQPAGRRQGEGPLRRDREDPDKRLLDEMYDLYMGGMAPAPEPDAERLIVRITPEKGYQFPPVPAAA